MDQIELPVYKLTEKYFTNTMVVQLKAYVMIQLSYLTKAAKVQKQNTLLFTYQFNSIQPNDSLYLLSMKSSKKKLCLTVAFVFMMHVFLGFHTIP